MWYNTKVDRRVEPLPPLSLYKFIVLEHHTQTTENKTKDHRTCVKARYGRNTITVGFEAQPQPWRAISKTKPHAYKPPRTYQRDQKASI